MGWAIQFIAKLKNRETVSFRPRGNSMRGKIASGQLCTVNPVEPEEIKVGDIVLCKVNGREYLHLVKAIQGQRFQIGNNRGRINGWISANSIFGKCVKIED
ncbi:MAG: S24/S26 family peptidase [Blastocatellia bacterium]